jgi:hypothetical protein
LPGRGGALRPRDASLPADRSRPPLSSPLNLGEGAIRAACSLDEERGGAFAFGFDVGPFDRTKELVIDPAMLLYCGCIGGEGHDYIHDVVLDAEGNLCVTGETTCSQGTFPVTVTLQGFLMDDGSASRKRASVTSAVILRVVDQELPGAIFRLFGIGPTRLPGIRTKKVRKVVAIEIRIVLLWIATPSRVRVFELD